MTKEMRMRPKSDYLQTAGLDELYVLTEHWQSDAAFFADELRFLHHLVGKYFIWMIKEENVSAVQGKTNQLVKMDQRLKRLTEKIGLQLGHLEGLLENAFSHNEQKFRDDHIQLEEEIASFTKDFKVLKKEVFALTEQVMESEKLRHLLT